MEEKIKSDGSTAPYYELPSNCKELQDLISHRNMNAQMGEIFRACYRYGLVAHSDNMRDIKKILFYANAELQRLERIPKREVYEKPEWKEGLPLPKEKGKEKCPAKLSDRQVAIIELLKKLHPFTLSSKTLCDSLKRDNFMTSAIQNDLIILERCGHIRRTDMGWTI